MAHRSRRLWPVPRPTVPGVDIAAAATVIAGRPRGAPCLPPPSLSALVGRCHMHKAAVATRRQSRTHRCRGNNAMQLSQPGGATLATLNEDCLLLICEQLAIRDQFALLQLGGRLRQLVLRLWRGKYANAFDWRREPQLESLSPGEQRQLLGHIAGLTRALLNLNLPELEARRKRKRKWQKNGKACRSMPNMQRLSLGPGCTSTALLRQLPRLCPNLVQLQLGAFVGVTPADICLLHGQLPQLGCFELLPGSGRICGAPAPALAAIQYGRALRTLRLPACALRAASAEIARLPQLRQLTGFLCCSGDKELANAGALATATISAWLAALPSGAASCRRQIVALRLQCQLDGCLPRLLASHLAVVRLERFAWHSLLLVHADATDGSIKWLPQAPQVPRAWLRFVVSQSESLRELDFMRNVHATPTFLARLTEQLGAAAAHVAVWHDARPRPQQTEADSSSGGGSDLAFVELHLREGSGSGGVGLSECHVK